MFAPDHGTAPILPLMLFQTFKRRFFLRGQREIMLQPFRKTASTHNLTIIPEIPQPVQLLRGGDPVAP